MSNNDTFQWTDELVVQCFEYIREDTAGVLTPVGVRKNVEYFKASHTQQEPERDWEITEVECYAGEIRRLVDGQYRIFDDGIGWTWEELSRRADTKIKSVRRLSDGEVFTVGEECSYNNKDWWAISGFDVYDGKIGVLTDVTLRNGETGNNWRMCFLKSAKKKPQVLSTAAIKPPLGLMPEYLHKEQRLSEIKEAIQRYLDAQKPVPIQWIAEQYGIEQWLTFNHQPHKTNNQ